MCADYPMYSVQMEGVGVPPADSPIDCGHCTQMAVFHCDRDYYERYVVPQDTPDTLDTHTHADTDDMPYEEVVAYSY